MIVADLAVTADDRAVAQMRLERLMHSVAQSAVSAAVEVLEAYLRPEDGLPRIRVSGVARSASGIVVALVPLVVDADVDLADHPGTGKVCSRCLQWLTYGHFYRNQSSSDGYTSACRPCREAAKRRGTRPRASRARR